MLIHTHVARMIAALTVSIQLVGATFAQDTGMPRSTPESQGVSSAGILAYIKAADAEVDSMHSFMLVRHGQVVAEAWWAPEAADKPHVLWSLSKLTATR